MPEHSTKQTVAPLPDAALLLEAGNVALRVFADVPSKARLFRLDQLIASAARRTLWLTDAYFVGFAPYVQALCAAALDAVDVRLLVPSTSWGNPHGADDSSLASTSAAAA